MSPPEKIFEVFATQKKEDAIYMSHYDLFKAVCPYTFSTKEKSEDVKLFLPNKAPRMMRKRRISRVMP